MIHRLLSYTVFVFLLACSSVHAQGPPKVAPLKNGDSIVPAAWRLNDYLPLLAGKKVALLINQTSTVGKTSLLDTLLKRGVKVVKIFVPEHGFRGNAEAGVDIANEVDSA